MSTTQDARKKFTMAKAQENLYALNVANVISEVDTSKMGTVYNPYASTASISNVAHTSNAYTVGTFSIDADSLQINRKAIASEIVGSYDQLSMDLNVIENRGMEFGAGISQTIDGYVLNLPVGTAGVTVLDDASFGGSAGNAITVGSGAADGIDDIINGAVQEIELNNAYDKKFMVVSSYEANDLRGFLQSTGNMVADEIIRNGFQSRVRSIGTTFSGVDVYQSNNLTQSIVLGLATQPTAGDTITFAGQTLTFVATLTGAANEIHIASTVDITRANLAEWFNGAGALSEAEAADTGYSASSTEGKAVLSRLGIVATNSNAADTLTIVTKGVVKVSEVLTNGTDTWATPSRYLVLGEYGFINLYIPSAGMDYEEKPVSGTDGVEAFMRQFFNATIWSKKKGRGVAIWVN